MSYDKKLSLKLSKFADKSYGYLTFSVKNDGFLFEEDSEGNQLLSFPGSDQTGDWISDFKFFKVKREGLGEIHDGFADCWDSLKNEVIKRIDKNKPLYITGHSYGAGIALIASVSLYNQGFKPTSVYTFGTPRVGNKDWKRVFDKTGIELYRIKNGNDMVCNIPKLFYYHVGQEVQINKRSWFSWLHSKFTDHLMSNYIDNLIDLYNKK